MKYIWAVIAAVAIVVVAAALLVYENTEILDDNNISDNSPSPPPPRSVTEFAIPKDIVTGNNDFAIDFYRQISDGNANILFSPTYIYVAFSMLYEGARENTAQQIQQVFGFEPDDALRYDAIADTMSSLNQDDPYTTLEMGNSLWLSHQFNAYDSYVNVVRDTYTADVKHVNFANHSVAGVVTRINNWATERTDDKINNVLTPESVNDLVAIALPGDTFFNGTWVTPFPEEDTRKSKFWKDNTTSITTDFMNVRDTFNYTQRDDVQVLKMPYKGDRFSMLVILPSDRNGIERLQEMISPDLILEWQHNMTETEMIVSIPKFVIKIYYDLKPLLINLGMTDVFNKEMADLSGITDTSQRNLYVSHALHDAYVAVNKEGTKANAITIVISTEEATVTPTFIADHPFIFIIQDDESDAILFMGRVSDPTS